jgi:hypothetical protein
MQGLMDVKTLAAAGRPYDGKEGSQHDLDNGALPGRYDGILTITFLDSENNPFQVPGLPAASTFMIKSGDHKVFGELLGPRPNTLRITVFSDSSEPIMASKQRRRKRRYIVENAPPIEEVYVNGVMAANLVYRAKRGTTALFPSTITGVQGDVIYTSVMVR